MVAPIGIFDSGMGGISVWQALHDALPEEQKWSYKQWGLPSV